MEYQPDVETSKSLQENPSSPKKWVAMIIPTPSKAKITGNRSLSETIEIKDEYQEAIKYQD